MLKNHHKNGQLHHDNTNQAILRSGSQKAVVERRKLHVGDGVGVGVEQRHSLALAAAVVQREHGQARPHVLPVERHHRRGSAYVVPVRLIGSDAYVAYARFRFRHDRSGIFVFRCFKTPRHFDSGDCLPMFSLVGMCKALGMSGKTI